jgi:hypothetical protein
MAADRVRDAPTDDDQRDYGRKPWVSKRMPRQLASISLGRVPRSRTAAPTPRSGRQRPRVSLPLPSRPTLVPTPTGATPRWGAWGLRADNWREFSHQRTEHDHMPERDREGMKCCRCLIYFLKGSPCGAANRTGSTRSADAPRAPPARPQSRGPRQAGVALHCAQLRGENQRRTQGNRCRSAPGRAPTRSGEGGGDRPPDT